jgi:hypothetical protein
MDPRFPVSRQALYHDVSRAVKNISTLADFGAEGTAMP